MPRYRDDDPPQAASDARLRAMRQALTTAWRNNDELSYREMVALAERGLSDAEWERFAALHLEPLSETPDSR